jgi:hypothetical protein
MSKKRAKKNVQSEKLSTFNFQLSTFLCIFASKIEKISIKSMELTGKIIAEFNERGGVSNRTGNEWKAKSYVLEVPGDFPRKLVFDVFGVDRLQAFNIQIGELLTVHFDIDAHEYNGRWFNDVRAFRIDRGQVAPTAAPEAVSPSAPVADPAPQVAPMPQEDPTLAPFEAPSSTDDLPF